MQGLKHYIECHCVLPQYRNSKKPIYFGFNVFSKIDDGNSVIFRFAECPNCGVLHKIYDICKSEILSGKDNASGRVRKISDLKLSIPENFIELLEGHNCELADYEKLEFILDHKAWNEYIMLNKDHEDDSRVGKILSFSDSGRPRVEPFITKE